MTKIYVLHWAQETNEYTRNIVIGYYSTAEKALKAENLFLYSNQEAMEHEVYISEVLLDIVPGSPTKEIIP